MVSEALNDHMLIIFFQNLNFHTPTIFIWVLTTINFCLTSNPEVQSRFWDLHALPESGSTYQIQHSVLLLNIHNYRSLGME